MNLQGTIKLIKKEFSFIEKYEYNFETERIYNQDIQNEIWVKLVASNEENGQKIRIAFYPNNDYNINVNILAENYSTAISMKEYLDHKTDTPTHYVPMHKLDKNNFAESLYLYAKEVERLFDGELQQVVNGEKWIEVSACDQRDEY